MSTSPYSLDLRKKVIKYIEQGNSQVSAAKLFDLNLSTVSRWYLRYKKEGHYQPRKRLGAKSKIDPKALESYVNSNPDSKLKDLAKKFGISLWGINYWLKKLGFSFKKNPFPTWKQTKKGALNT
jgi:transposase